MSNGKRIQENPRRQKRNDRPKKRTGLKVFGIIKNQKTSLIRKKYN